MTRGQFIKPKLNALLILTLLCINGAVGAQDDLELIGGDLEDDILNSEQIDIDGTYKRTRPTAADRLQKMRKNLEKRNENMVRKKIENARISEEKKMTGKLRKMFEGKSLLDDEDLTNSALAKARPAPVAPAPTTIRYVMVPPKKKSSNAFEKFKVIPSFGILSVNGDVEDYESKINIGIAIESMINSRISIGLSFNYARIDIENSDPFSNYPYNNVFNYPNYNSNNNVVLEYRHLAVELTGKFFLLPNSRVKPYLGVGLGYNKARLEYENTQQISPYNYPYGNYDNEDYASNFISGSGLLGAEISISETIGINLEFKYSRALTDGSQQKNSSYSDEYLYNTGDDLSDAVFTSINLGVVATF